MHKSCALNDYWETGSAAQRDGEHRERLTATFEGFDAPDQRSEYQFGY